MNPNNSCGCTGIRTCLLCETGRGVLRCSESLPALQRYVLCSTCQRVRTGPITQPCDQPCAPAFADSPDAGLGHVLVFPAFVSEAEEAEMMAYADTRPWRASQSGRNKQDFGPKINFKKRKVNYECFSGLPPFSRWLLPRVQALAGLETFEPVEQCHLEYTPDRGSGIDAHIDDPWIWGEHLVTVNLLSDTVLSFVPPADHPAGTAFEVCVYLPRFSLVVVHGDARHKWLHAVRREDIGGRRIAVTLRELGPTFLAGGEDCEVGDQLVKRAFTFAGESVEMGPDGRS